MTAHQLSNTASAVVMDVIERERIGLAKYGTTCDRMDLSAGAWIEHAREEMLDGAMYLTALRRQLPVQLRAAFDAGYAASQMGHCRELAFEHALAGLMGAKA